ncbi:MAG: hypothetical protein U0232_04490 [Thermomicrobiales bacterium]
MRSSCAGSARLREEGVTDYQFLKVGEAGELVLLVPIGGALWARGDEALRRLPGTEGARCEAGSQMGHEWRSCAMTGV